jgi:ATP-dependent Clp protease ATP-binding subunit ClpC
MDNELQAVFARLTEGARHVVVSAREEARTLRHGYIGTEHILLGLLREEAAPTARVLESFHVTQARARAQVARRVGSGEEQVAGDLPFTPRAVRALQFALSEAVSLRHEHINTDHLLLGLVRGNDGMAVRILADLDVDTDRIHAKLVRRRADGNPGQS